MEKWVHQYNKKQRLKLAIGKLEEANRLVGGVNPIPILEIPYV